MGARTAGVQAGNGNYEKPDAVELTAVFGADGRSGFGTGSTGARVTVGGAIVTEQVVEQ